jgi:hypothetical protein
MIGDFANAFALCVKRSFVRRQTDKRDSGRSQKFSSRE